MKHIERLREQKNQALDRMSALTKLAADNNRDLNEAELAEYSTKKAEAEALQKQIDVALKAEEHKPAAVPTVVDEAELKRQATDAERLRGTTIYGRVAAAKLSSEFAKKLVDEGKTLEQANEAIFAELAKVKPETSIRPNHTASMDTDARDKMKEAMTGALLHRMDAKKHPLGEARDFAGLSLLEMARECLEAVGVKTRGMTRDQIATAALIGAPRGVEFFSGSGMMSTSDLPNILIDAFNKRLRMAYEAAPRTFMAFAKQSTAPDFKNVNVTQLSDISAFQKVNEHGEFKSATLSDSKETYKLATYGEILLITRQTLINDDLRALDRANTAMGNAAARLENETVWGVITTNAAMADSVALFHATHKNLQTGAGSALGTTALAAARTAMRTMKGPKGQVLNIVPRTLILPAALESTGLSLVFPQQLAASDVTKVVVEWIRNLTPVIEPLLDANSTTAWYLAADPGQIDTVEYCYLEGQEGVYIETRNGFEVDGVEIKARLDFAAAAIEYRGLQKNAGA